MNLEKFRNNLNISQRELSKKLNIPQTTYSNYERKRNEPDIETLIKLANFYKVPIDTLVERKFNNIDFSKCTDTHFELIEKVSNLTEVQCEKLLGYIDGQNNK